MGVIMILLVVGIFILDTRLHRNLAVLDACVVAILIQMTVESLLTIKVGLLHAEETEDGDESAETRVEKLDPFLWSVCPVRWDREPATYQYGFPPHTVEDETTHKRRQGSAEIKKEYIKAHR
jgi:hypothetical protein